MNDEFVPIHMDDEAGRAQGFPGAFGMGNLMWSYLHNLVRDWMGDNGRIVAMGCSFRSPNLRGMTVEARGTVTAVRDEGGERLVDLELVVVDHDNARHRAGAGDRDGRAGLSATRAARGSCAGPWPR